jgi:hypothetical protein
MMSQIDHTHAPSADYLHYFKAPDFLANKILSSRRIFKVALIGLHERIEQSIDFLKILQPLSELMLKLRVLFHKFICIRLLAMRPGMNKLLYGFFNGSILIVANWSGHQTASKAPVNAAIARENSILAASALLSNLSPISL